MNPSKDGTTEESPREKEIRYMNDLLQELRVILPGVQVTFAFLLTVAFMDRFAEATALQRSVYFAALLSTALATAFFIAPTIQHRILWRKGERATRLKIGNGLLIAGTVLLAIGMSCATFWLPTSCTEEPGPSWLRPQWWGCSWGCGICSLSTGV